MSDLTAAAAGTITIGGDLTVNRLGFGAMRITGPGVWGPPADHDEAVAVLRRAVDLGVNFIDTADAYGPEVSENLIAEALHPYPDDLVVATKGGIELTAPGVGKANGRPDHLRAACEGSLRRLRVDRIDVYQYHRPDPEVPLADAIGALLELQAEGKIRHIGVSNVSERLLREAQRSATVVSVQNRYNVAERKSESLVETCQQESIAFLPWGPIQDAADREAVRSAARSHGATVTQVVLAWLLARSPAMLPIPGTGSISHLEENVAAAGLSLDDEEIRAITGSQVITG